MARTSAPPSVAEQQAAWSVPSLQGPYSTSCLSRRRSTTVSSPWAGGSSTGTTTATGAGSSSRPAPPWGERSAG